MDTKQQVVVTQADLHAQREQQAQQQADLHAKAAGFLREYPEFEEFLALLKAGVFA